MSDQKPKKKTPQAHGGNPLTRTAKAIGARLGKLAIKASQVAAAGQQAALLPAVTTKKARKKAAAPIEVLAKKTVSKRGRKAAAQTGPKKSLKKPARKAT